MLCCVVKVEPFSSLILLVQRRALRGWGRATSSTGTSGRWRRRSRARNSCCRPRPRWRRSSTASSTGCVVHIDPPVHSYSQLRLSRISGDLTNHFDLDKIQVTALYTFVCLGNWDKGKWRLKVLWLYNAWEKRERQRENGEIYDILLVKLTSRD